MIKLFKQTFAGYLISRSFDLDIDRLVKKPITNKQTMKNELIKEFVPYEEALALKELGFDEPCFGYWGLDEDSNVILETRSVSQNGDLAKKSCTAPTFSQAFRWFREKHELECCLKMNYDILNSRIMYLNGKEVSRFIIGDKKWELMNRDSEAYKRDSSYYDKTYTYEEAELACLKKLIEIVESKS